MRVGLRDVWATLLTALAVGMGLSVTQGWDWPLLGDYRAASIAMLLVGLVACPTSWAPGTVTRFSFTDPYILLVSAIGTLLLVFAVIGIFANTAVWVIAAMAAWVALWLVATIAHVVLAPGAPPRPAAAA